MSLFLKACPKCKMGDIEVPRTLSIREDPECIQCGFMVNINSVARMRRAKLEAKKEAESIEG